MRNKRLARRQTPARFPGLLLCRPAMNIFRKLVGVAARAARRPDINAAPRAIIRETAIIEQLAI
jgi:hypothetical protein